MVSKDGPLACSGLLSMQICNYSSLIVSKDGPLLGIYASEIVHKEWTLRTSCKDYLRAPSSEPLTTPRSQTCRFEQPIGRNPKGKKCPLIFSQSQILSLPCHAHICFNYSHQEEAWPFNLMVTSFIFRLSHTFFYSKTSSTSSVNQWNLRLTHYQRILVCPLSSLGLHTDPVDHAYPNPEQSCGTGSQEY
jgi:hypothetical protein